MYTLQVFSRCILLEYARDVWQWTGPRTHGHRRARANRELLRAADLADPVSSHPGGWIAAMAIFAVDLMLTPPNPPLMEEKRDQTGAR